ncbi:hypothetical protein [Hamadaea tsunoensis]|uniref:hypothetical protein n=1 Tax=Hamadaea tsunoensis TaxID=53368 RepID=UPI00042A65A6|nr:hypothetical protein [Hamadaea tsunoensis]
MTRTLVHQFLLGVPGLAGLWLLLLAVAAVGIAGIVVPLRRNRVTVRPVTPDLERLATRTREWERYAEEMTAAADRATTGARLHRGKWLAAQADVERAWRVFDAADRAAGRLTAASRLPVPRTARTPAEYASRERFLHRAAMAACSRNELPLFALSDALAGRNGWNPKLHPVEQERVLRLAVRDAARSAHAASIERERAAWTAAEEAHERAVGLRAEAAAAAENARVLSPRLRAFTLPLGQGRGFVHA